MLGTAGLLLLMALILGVASLATSIWLVVVAFRKGPGWGLAVLFLPFAAIVFAVRNWQESKKPFLASLVTAVGSGIFLAGTFLVGASAVSKQIADQMSQEMAKSSIQVRTEPRTAPVLEPRVEPEAAPAPDSAMAVVESHGLAAPDPSANPLPASEPVPFSGSDITSDGYAEVAFRDANRALGRPARLYASDGRVHEGDLVGATTGSVEIEHRFRSGSIVVEYRKAEIQKLLVRVVP